MPIASTFMFLMGCCGESILHIPKISLAMGVDDARGEQLRPQIDSDAGLRVLDYLHRLKEVSPPDILEMDWDRRTTAFLSGQTALAYCWTVRAARFEMTLSSAVKRKVSYLPQPRGPAGASNNPIGGFLLCIPSNLSPERVELAFEGIAWMTSPEAMKANVQNGFPVAPRFSVSADPEAAATRPSSASSTSSPNGTCSKPGRVRPCPNISIWRPFWARRSTGRCAGKPPTKKRSEAPRRKPIA